LQSWVAEEPTDNKIMFYPALDDPNGLPLTPDEITDALAANPYRAPGRGPVPVSASIGTAAFPEQGRTARALIAAADVALNRVKGAGGAAGAGSAANAPRRPKAAQRGGPPATHAEDAPLADAV
jgi:predicted signal transduction protein with EAL and GGDEF domain